MSPAEEIHYRILKALDENPNVSQRELANGLGISLGKVNYCLREIITRGWVQGRTVPEGESRRGQGYVLTRKGLEEKARATLRFLKHRIAEQEAIEKEIEQLRVEAERDSHRQLRRDRTRRSQQRHE